MDFNGDNLQQIYDETWGFAFDGETIAWHTLLGEIFMMAINIGDEIHPFSQEIDPFDLVLTEDYIVATDWFDGLHVANRSTNDARHLAAGVLHFAVVGDYIVYEHWDTFDIHVMDFYGNSRVLIVDEWN